MKILNANRIQYHNHYITYLSGSAFLANLTPSNKQSFKVKSEFKSRNHVSNSQAIKAIIIWTSKNCCLFVLSSFL